MKTFLLELMICVVIVAMSASAHGQTVKLTRYGDYYRWNREPMIPICLQSHAEEGDGGCIETLVPTHIITGCIGHTWAKNGDGDLGDCIKRPWVYLMESGFCYVRPYACTAKDNKKSLKQWAREKIREQNK